jgi:serine/threonine-protein kinase
MSATSTPPPLTERATDSSSPLERAKARVGTLVRGKWRLDTLLDAGGTAAVYAATHRNRSRAAIKMLHPELSAQPSIRGAFLREGYAANGVPHDGVVHVIDDDVAEDGSVFTVLELLDGRTLRSLLDEKAGPLALEEALRIADKVLDVLAVAHAQGIQHRDVTPKNVFLLGDGRIKLIDFGSAFVAELSQQSGATLSGLPMGTPAFMSPELARGRFADVDPRSDVWSAGALLYTMLTGKPIRKADTPNEELLLAMTEPPPSLGSARPTLPRELIEVVDRAVAFEKKDRWPGARAMQEAVVAAKASMSRALTEVVAEGVGPDMGEKTDILFSVQPSAPPPGAVLAHANTVPAPSPSSTVRVADALTAGGPARSASSGHIPAAMPAPMQLAEPVAHVGTIVTPAPLGGFEGGLVPYLGPDNGMNPLFATGEPKQTRSGSDPKISASYGPTSYSPMVRARPRVGAIVAAALLVLGALVATALILVDRQTLPLLARSSAATSTSTPPKAPATAPDAPKVDPIPAPEPVADSKPADPTPAPSAQAPKPTATATSTSSSRGRRGSAAAAQSSDIVRVNPFDRRE